MTQTCLPQWMRDFNLTQKLCTATTMSILQKAIWATYLDRSTLILTVHHLWLRRQREVGTKRTISWKLSSFKKTWMTISNTSSCQGRRTPHTIQIGNCKKGRNMENRQRTKILAITLTPSIGTDSTTWLNTAKRASWNGEPRISQRSISRVTAW